MGIDLLFSVSSLSALAVVGTGLLAAFPLLAAGSAMGLFRFSWQSFGDVFRSLPEREKSWGTVYDSSTLRPVPFAVIRLLGIDERIMEKRIADKDGRFVFLTSPASLQLRSVEVKLEVSAAGYAFPSIQGSGVAHVVYGNLYHGGRLKVAEDTLINIDIPMDPIGRSTSVGSRRPPSVKAGVGIAAMADAGLWVGLLAVPLSFILDPTYFSLGVLFVFFGVTSLRVFGIAERPYGTVSDRNGRAVPFALVTLHNDAGQRAAYAVSDERGRFVIAVARGSYVLTAHTPANVTPVREVERSITTRKGWITKEIIL